MNPSSTAQALAQQLLAAQVAHAHQQLTGANAVELMAVRMDEILDRASHFQLNQVVSREAIRGVIHTYAFDMNLGAGVIELIGAMARQLHHTMNHHAPTLQQLMPSSSIEQWIEKIIELRELRQQFSQRLQGSSTAQHLLSHVLSAMIRHQVPTWVEHWQQRAQHVLQGRTPKVLQRLINADYGLFDRLSQQLAEVIQQHSSQMVALDDDSLRALLEQLWHGIKTLHLSELTHGLSALDIEEFFVLIYEDWRRLRKIPFIQQLILTGTDVFFDVYGEYSLVDLLDEVGVTRAHMVGEIVRFAPPVIAALAESGDLSTLLEQQFAPFYQHPNTLAILHNALQPPTP